MGLLSLSKISKNYFTTKNKNSFSFKTSPTTLNSVVRTGLPMNTKIVLTTDVSKGLTEKPSTTASFQSTNKKLGSNNTKPMTSFNLTPQSTLSNVYMTKTNTFTLDHQNTSNLITNFKTNYSLTTKTPSTSSTSKINSLNLNINLTETSKTSSFTSLDTATTATTLPTHDISTLFNRKASSENNNLASTNNAEIVTKIFHTDLKFYNITNTT